MGQRGRGMVGWKGGRMVGRGGRGVRGVRGGREGR